MNNLPVLGNETEYPPRRRLLDRCRNVARSLARIPLFFKIVLANSAVAIVVGIAGAGIATWHVKGLPASPHYDLMILLIAISLTISLAVNCVALKLALNPLERLQETAHNVRQGKLDASVVTGPVSDERLDLLIDTFNQMLSTLQQNTQQLRHLSQQALRAREQERQRIARELHDEAGQTLTSLLLYLKLLEKSQNSEEAQRIQNLRRLTAHALDEIRQVAVQLYPKALDEWGLEAALGRRVDEMNTADCIRVTLHVEGNLQNRLPKELELAFYRVAQEALNNIARHSRAQRAQVTLKREAHCLTLEIHDDGIGFNTAVLPGGRSRGLGLAGMRDRLALVGGEIVIESQLGRGTRIIARAPLVPI